MLCICNRSKLPDGSKHGNADATKKTSKNVRSLLFSMEHFCDAQNLFLIHLRKHFSVH